MPKGLYFSGSGRRLHGNDTIHRSVNLRLRIVPSSVVLDRAGYALESLHWASAKSTTPQRPCICHSLKGSLCIAALYRPSPAAVGGVESEAREGASVTDRVSSDNIACTACMKHCGALHLMWIPAVDLSGSVVLRCKRGTRALFRGDLERRVAFHLSKSALRCGEPAASCWSVTPTERFDTICRCKNLVLGFWAMGMDV